MVRKVRNPPTCSVGNTQIFILVLKQEVHIRTTVLYEGHNWNLLHTSIYTIIWKSSESDLEMDRHNLYLTYFQDCLCSRSSTQHTHEVGCEYRHVCMTMNQAWLVTQTPSLVFCGLFYNVVPISDCTAWNRTMTGKWFGRKGSLPDEGTPKFTFNVRTTLWKTCQENLHLGQDSKATPPPPPKDGLSVTPTATYSAKPSLDSSRNTCSIENLLRRSWPGFL